MRFLAQFALAAAATLVGRAAAYPLSVTPGDSGTLVLTLNNTINATVPANAPTAPLTGQLDLSLVNNLNGGAVNAYVTGLDSNNKLVLLQPDGTWYYPAANGATTPQPITANVAIPLSGYGQSTQLTLPSYISSARLWFAEGSLQFFVVQGDGGPSLVEPSAVNPSDPSANVNWGFVELTYTEEGGLYANISYVDFVGLVLGMSLTCQDGSNQTALGLSPTAVSSICADLQSQATTDGQPWDDLCVCDTTGTPLRVLNPTDYLSINPSAFESYFDEYITSVWSYYTTNTLSIDTQAAAGIVSCTVQNDLLTCDGDNRGYAQPTAADIFGCNSGPFAIEAGDNAVHYAVVPRLCAAFDRSTLMLDGGAGAMQPGVKSTSYYTTQPTNWYSAIVHKYEVDAKGYAFSYDDVDADGDVNSSGVVAAMDPAVLQVTIGGPSS